MTDYTERDSLSESATESDPRSLEDYVSLNATTIEEQAVTLASGGFTGDTEVLTIRGPRRVDELNVGESVYALNPVTKITAPKQVLDIQKVPHDGDLISLETRRANLLVTPDHLIPYETKGVSRVRFRRAGDLHQQGKYRFINDWRVPTGRPLHSVDITDLTDEYEISAETDAHGHTFRAALPDGCEPVRCNSHTGYFFDPETFEEYQSDIEKIADRVSIHAKPGHHRKPYKFDGNDFIQFIGWFVTEGSVYWKAGKETAEVQIAQEFGHHHEQIESLLDRMGLAHNTSDRDFTFGSYLYGRVLERLCGPRSDQKRLPGFVWNLSTSQKQLLLNILMAGDGNERGTYYTSSPRLAGDVCRLCVELGRKAHYSRRGKMWRVSTTTVNDGFHSDRNVRRQTASQPVYRLTLSDYSTVLAGRDGLFQWVGVSRVA